MFKVRPVCIKISTGPQAPTIKAITCGPQHFLKAVATTCGFLTCRALKVKQEELILFVYVVHTTMV